MLQTNQRNDEWLKQIVSEGLLEMNVIAKEIQKGENIDY